MNELRVIAITHKNFPIETIGRFHVSDDKRFEWLSALRASTGVNELMYLSTCNRVEFIFTLPHYVCPGFTAKFLQSAISELDETDCQLISNKAERYNQHEAVEHLLRVSSSLDSVVIGEHEIITQFRKSFEDAHHAGTTGEVLRLVTSQCIETAKEIFTHTHLSTRQVSIVSLAWQQFLKHDLHKDARILIVGAGQTSRNFLKFLNDHNYRNVTIANRTLLHAEKIAEPAGAKAISIDMLANFDAGFDVLFSSTGSSKPIITAALFEQLIKDDSGKKLLIDLALPGDVEVEIRTKDNVKYIGLEQVKAEAAANVEWREASLKNCEDIIQSGFAEFEKTWQQRKIEIAMRSIPQTIKEIKSTALGQVFAKDLENLDENSRELLEKIMDYMEKKYISIPMKMAREVLLEAVSKN